MYRRYIKRVIDLIGATTLFILFSPFLVIIGFLIKIDSNGKVFYRQERLGKSGKIFRIYKFRTMVSNAENIGSGLFTYKSDARITRVGNFLRKYSIDELPQIINILVGHMSFIGPRPPVPYHPYNIEEYPEKYKVRFLFKPGVTGWAQIHGRTNLTWTQRLEYDVEYYKKFSLQLDIRIFFITIKKIMQREDVYPEDINIGKKHLNNN